MKHKTILILTLIFLCTLFLAQAQSTSDYTTPDIEVSLLEYNPSPVQPGQVMDVHIQIANDGSMSGDTYIELVEEYPFTIEPSQDLERAKNLGPVAGAQTLLFRVRIDENAKDSIAPLRVIYSTDRNLDFFVEKTFDIVIETFDARIEVAGVTQEPKEIMPGETGTFSLKLKNNDDRPLKNIDIVLDLTNSYDPSTNMENMISMQAMINARLEEVDRRVASGLSPLKGATPMMAGGMNGEGMNQLAFQAFAPEGLSNQKTIREIQPNDEIQIDFDLRALPNIMPNIYAVPVYINYNDEDNNPFHVRVDVPITVNMKPELYVDLQSTTLRTTDFAGEIVFNVANRGLSELRYVTLELEDHDTLELLTAPQSIYIGDLQPGEAKAGTFSVIAHEEDIAIPVEVSYRDSFNKAHTEKKIIPFKIINKNYYRDLPYEMWLAWIILGVVMLLLTIFYVKNMSKKKEH